MNNRKTKRALMAVGSGIAAVALLVGASVNAQAKPMYEGVSGTVANSAGQVGYFNSTRYQDLATDDVSITLVSGIDMNNGLRFRSRNYTNGTTYAWTPALNVNTLRPTNAAWRVPVGTYYLEWRRDTNCSILCDSTWSGQYGM